jgi:hypothetical protein
LNEWAIKPEVEEEVVRVEQEIGAFTAMLHGECLFCNKQNFMEFALKK